MYNKYCGKKSPLATTTSGRNSPTWRRLAASWAAAQPNIRWALGDGKALFWDDVWLGEKSLRDSIIETRGNSKTRVAELWRNGQWDRSKVRRFQRQTGIPQHIADEILSMPILGGRGDVPRWTLTRCGEFSVASAWESSRSRRPIIQELSDVWNKGLTTTISIFMWRLISNRVPVDTKLQWRNISLASKCLCCNARPEIESLQHLFVQGQGASRVWRFFDGWFMGPNEPLLEEDTIPTRLGRWGRRTSQNTKEHLARVAPCIICWYLWAERNNCRHNGVRFRANSVIWHVQLYIQRLIESGRIQWKHLTGVHYDSIGISAPQPRAPLRRAMVIKWHPPDHPWLKLNTKGMQGTDGGRAGGGMVLRDYQGNLVTAIAATINERSELGAELEAICLGLTEAKEHNQPIWVESSSQQVVTLIDAGEWGPADIRHSMVKLRLLRDGCTCRFTYTRPEGNKAACLLARLGIEVTSVRKFDSRTAPRLLRAIIRLEGAGVPNLGMETDGEDPN